MLFPVDRPRAEEYPEWAAEEIQAVPYYDLISGLEESHTEINRVLTTMPSAAWLYRYAEGKWSVKEIVQHLIDTERVLSYRALRYARNDDTVLHGIKSERYVAESFADYRSHEALVEEYATVRRATLSLFKSFTSEVFDRKGTAGKSTFTVRAVGFLILGHEVHHLKVIRKNYLPAALDIDVVYGSLGV